MAPNQDEAVIELLELVDQYEKLANDKFRVNLISGMQNLSRANFNSENRKYGPDSYDRRPYEACKVVKYGHGFSLDDKLKKANEEKRKKKEEMKADEKKTKDEAVVADKTGSEKITEKNNAEESSLRSRVKQKEKKGMEPKSVTKEETPVPGLRDPIYQFGVLVPYQLRAAQTAFSESVADIVEMVNLRQKINEKVAQIEQTL